MEQQEINQRIEERKGNNVYSNIVTALWRWGFENDNNEAVACESLQDVVDFVGKRFRDDANDDPNVCIMVQGKQQDLTDKYIFAHSEVYKTDDRNGVCADGDPLSIRYVKLDVNRVFKMRCGKFFRRLVDEMHPELPEAVRVYFVEQLAAMYRAGHAADGRYTLTLDRDFEKIYSVEGFGSCMTNKGQWHFYEDSSPDAMAAALWDGDELIARCIVWNATDDDSGETFRLAERQYGKNDEAKRQLVYLLSEQGKIDGHKEFNSSCCDNRRFVLLNGDSLANRHLSVRCDAESGSICSYQDSFRYLKTGDGRAYNYECGYDYDLSTTEHYIDECDPDDGEVRDGQRYVAYDGEWYNEDYCSWLEYRSEWRHDDDCCYSEWTDQSYLSDDCTCLYDDTYCHEDDAREIEAGAHEGQYAYVNDDELTTDYDGRKVLNEDCETIWAGRYEEKLAPSDEVDELSEKYYGRYCYMLNDSDETALTWDGEWILLEDAVEIDGDIYHKNDAVRAMNRQTREMQWCLRDECVEICGTFYLMDVA